MVIDLIYPVQGTHQSWQPTAAQVEQWQALYPTLDVAQELRSALAWTLANPSKRKTARGMPRFLSAWLTRSAVDVYRSIGVRTRLTDTDVRREYYAWLDAGGCPHTPRCGNYTTCQVVAARR